MFHTGTVVTVMLCYWLSGAHSTTKHNRAAECTADTTATEENPLQSGSSEPAAAVANKWVALGGRGDHKGKTAGLNFSSLSGMRPEDAGPVDAAFSALLSSQRHATRLLDLVRAGAGLAPNVVVDLREHGVQMATLGLRAEWDEEFVVAALLHDIGELLAPNNHGEVAAAALRPYVTPRTAWVLGHHEVTPIKRPIP